MKPVPARKANDQHPGSHLDKEQLGRQPGQPRARKPSNERRMGRCGWQPHWPL